MKLCVKRDLSEHDIVSRIMRKDNYLIGAGPSLLASRVLRASPDSGCCAVCERTLQNNLHAAARLGFCSDGWQCECQTLMRRRVDTCERRHDVRHEHHLTTTGVTNTG